MCMRGASTACCMFMPKSTTLRMLSNVDEMMVEPPGLPVTMNTLPCFSTMLGTIEDSEILPGWISLTWPCTSPNELGTPGLEVKSSIVLLRKKPVSPAIMPTPNR